MDVDDGGDSKAGRRTRRLTMSAWDFSGMIPRAIRRRLSSTSSVWSRRMGHSIGWSVCISIGLSVSTSVGWLVGLGRSACRSVFRPIGFSVCVSVGVVCPYFGLSASRSVFRSVGVMSVSVFICLFVRSLYVCPFAIRRRPM